MRTQRLPTDQPGLSLGTRQTGSVPVVETTEHRAVVIWEGPGEPIILTLYGPAGEVAAVRLLPKRAMTLAQELLRCGVQAIKADQWGAE